MRREHADGRHGGAPARRRAADPAGRGLRALQELCGEGRGGAIGLAASELDVVSAAMKEFELDCTLLAGRYSLFGQEALSPLLDACVRDGNAIVIGDPFNGGVLSANGALTFFGADAGMRARAIAALRRQFGVPLAAAALQFPMAHRAVVSCVPGAHGVAQLRQNAA